MPDDWPPYHPKHYTTLALIHHKGKITEAKVLSVISKLAAEGNMVSCSSKIEDHEAYSDVTKNIDDLFTTKRPSDGLVFHPKTILIEGAPGIGKTVLSKEIANQWAKNTLLNSKKLLFLVQLRNFHSNSIHSLETFLQRMFRNNEMSSNIAKYVTANSGEDLVLVLDGYDEMSEEDRVDSFISDVIHRQVLSNCLLVITSRPTASLHLHDSTDCRVEVVGFTEEDRLDYIKSALPSAYDEVKQYLHFNPIINALCYVPLNMTILLCLVEDDINNLPNSQTELYKKFIIMTIKRYMKRISNLRTSYVTNISDLPPYHSELFKELSHFAFKALKHDRLVFTLPEIHEVCPNLTKTPSNWNGMGLLNSIRSFEFVEKVSYHFLHFSIQEFMAAYHISILSHKAQIKLLKETFWNVRYYNTWIMYAGITGGKSFALKHFFSGHWFRLSTRLFGISAISRKKLKDKINCLHIFQCLAETQDDKVVSLIGNLFQEKTIDLSDQTISPNGLNALSFFLIRSLIKNWYKLDLSNCNIRNNGCKILLDNLLGKSNLKISCVDLSYNQLTFSSLVELYDLLKSWYVTQLFIKDNTVLEDATSAELFASLENAFIGNKTDKTHLQTVSIGSFLFAHQDNTQKTLFYDIPAAFYTTIYVQGVTSYPYGVNSLINLLHSQTVTMVNIHLLDTQLIESSLEALDDILSDHKISSLFIYDSTLSDEVADGIGHQLLSISSASVLLVASRSKVLGILNTCSLSAELSNLEILNLIVKVRSLNCNSTPCWNNSLRFHGNTSEGIIQGFLDMMLNLKAPSCEFKLKIVEQNTMIANGVDFNDLVKDLPPYLSLSAIYISGCQLNYRDLEILLKRCSSGGSPLSILYIVHCSLQIEAVCTMLSGTCNLKELFFHSHCAASKESILTSLSLFQSTSVLLLASNNLSVHNPTNQQLAVAFKLKPSATVWIFLACKVNTDTFYLISDMLTGNSKTWLEIDLIDCNLTYSECKIICGCLISSKVKRLTLTSGIFPLSITSALVEAIWAWKVEELIISDESNYEFYKNVIEVLENEVCFCKSDKQLNLTVSYSTQKVCFYYNVDWSVIAATSDSMVCAIFLVNCPLFNPSECEVTNIISKWSKLSQLFVINSSLTENIVVCLLKTVLHKNFVLAITDIISIDGNTLCNLIADKAWFHAAKVHFVAIMENFLCGYNTSEYQLHFLSFFNNSFNTLERKIISIADESKVAIDKDLFIFHNHQLHALRFIANKNADISAQKIISAIKDTSFVKLFGIDNLKITNDDIKYIFVHNSEIETVYLNDTCNSNDVLEMMLCILQSVSKLKTLEINNNFITDKEMNYVLRILCNNQIEDMGI